MHLFKDGVTPIVIFCDGACSGNPGKGGWGAVVVTPDAEVTELGAGSHHTTNNKMELAAAIRALDSVRDVNGVVQVYTDSVYVIRGITQWIWGWKKRGWKTAEGGDVANRDEWEALLRVTMARAARGKIEWRFVKGHSGVPGNERCDEIAVAFTKGLKIKLYKGPLLKYDVAVLDIPDDTSVPEPREKAPKTQAHSYVSVVDGVAQRHKTWAECERRVKGRSGAKFKKAQSAADEAKILAGWGVRLD